MVCSLAGSSVHGILQAIIVEWVAISSSRGSSRSRDQTHVSYISFIASRVFTTEPPGKPKITLEQFLTAKELARGGVENGV